MTTNTKNNVEVKATEQVQGKEGLQGLQSIMANNKINDLKDRSMSQGRGGYISLVKAKRNGTRLTINKKSNERLGYPKELFVGFDNEYLVIFNAEGLDGANVKLDKNDKEELNIYRTSLVNLIIDEFNLDYSDRTSRSFSDGHFKDQGRPVLYVKMV